MIDQTNATLQEVLSQASSTEAIKLLTWCVSVAVPLSYINEAESMAAHQEEGISIASESYPLHPNLSVTAYQLQFHVGVQLLNQ